LSRANVFSDDCKYDADDADGYRSGVASAGEAAGGRALSVKVFELPPGQSVCPYHYEYEEEWLVVLDGSVLLRSPEGEEIVVCGAIVCFSPGPAGAHKVTSASDQTARVMMFSSARQPAVAVYPDSAKIGLWPGNPDDQLMFRRADGEVGYFDGEQ